MTDEPNGTPMRSKDGFAICGHREGNFLCSKIPMDDGDTHRHTHNIYRPLAAAPPLTGTPND